MNYDFLLLVYLGAECGALALPQPQRHMGEKMGSVTSDSTSPRIPITKLDLPGKAAMSIVAATMSTLNIIQRVYAVNGASPAIVVTLSHRICPAAHRWHNHLDKKSMIQAEIEHPTGHTQQNFAHHRNIAEMAGVERHLSVTTICSGLMLISVFRSQAANAMLADIFNVIRVGEFRHYTNLTFFTTRGCSITPQSAVRRRTCSEAFYALATENIL
ncbi:TPA: hypothetical protein N3A33_000851 [Salmonella enterica subsp. salamae serovar 28:r:e,n,z15]|nr:hypothetical protein [Salmonella enterica subsp. salamae serovar 28:r:e,n,z15]